MRARRSRRGNRACTRAASANGERRCSSPPTVPPTASRWRRPRTTATRSRRACGFADVEAIRSCTQQACLDDCWQKVTIELWPPAVCGRTAGGRRGNAQRAGGGGGCSAAGSTDASPGAGFVAAIGALAVVGARLRSKRRRRRTARGRAVAVALLALIAAPGAARGVRQDEDPRRHPRGAARRAASPSRFTSTRSRASPRRTCVPR